MELQPLDFEKPIFELQRRLQDLKAHSDEHDVDLDSAVGAIEAKLRQTRREIYGNLTAWQRVQIARHVQRPFALDYVERCFKNWTELHGDRRFADDKAMPSGLAMLGIGVADRVLILENAYYSVISPEACSAILWRDRRHAAEAAEALKLTARDLLKLEVVDEIVPEPEGGAHRDYDSIAENFGTALRENLELISGISIEDLLTRRYEKFRRIGGFAEPKPTSASARS